MTPSDEKKRIDKATGDLLRALRVERGLTQAALAEESGVDRSWLNQIEAGNRTLGKSPRAKLAKALKVSPLELGAPEEEAGPKWRPLHVRLLEAEAALTELVPELRRLADRVELLEQKGRTKSQPAATRKKAAR